MSKLSGLMAPGSGGEVHGRSWAGRSTGCRGWQQNRLIDSHAENGCRAVWAARHGRSG